MTAIQDISFCASFRNLFFQTFLGRLCLGFHTYIWGYDTRIKEAIESLKISTDPLFPNSQTIHQIFEACQFNNGWLTDTKRKQIEKVYKELQNTAKINALPLLIKKINKVKSEKELNLLSADFPEFEITELWYLYTLKLIQGKIDPSSLDIEKLSDSSDLEKSWAEIQSREIAPPVRSLKTEERQDAYEGDNAKVIVRTTLLNIFSTDLNGFPSEDIDIAATIYKKLIPPNIASATMKSTFEVDETGKEELKKTDFRIELTAPQTTQLSENGIRCLSNSFLPKAPQGRLAKAMRQTQSSIMQQALKYMNIRTEQVIEGTIDQATKKISFKPGCITGDMSGKKGQTLLSLQYDPQYLDLLTIETAPIDNPHQSITRGWVKEDFIGTFQDLSWPS